MRIERIHVTNFKLFEDMSMTLHPQFTLLIGENGSGKTSILDALAVACGVWLMDVPDPQIRNSRRPLYDSEIRLLPSNGSDPPAPALEAMVAAWGSIADQPMQWTREILFGKKSYAHLKETRDAIKELYRQATEIGSVLLPVIAYYGAGRAWLAHRARYKKLEESLAPSRRWSAFYDCLDERIRFDDLKHWFWNEETARGRRQGRYRPGFEVVRRAILRCVPRADDIWFDPDSKDIFFSIAGNAQPSSNLSAGQRMMLAMVADIAIKMVTQNSFLVPPDDLRSDEDASLPRVLAETPGVVLIDELDVHLHPRWQRRVANDLKTTFPNIQFVCTTHSPQVIGEVPPEETRGVRPDGRILPLAQAVGLDSNTILEEVMGAESETRATDQMLDEAERALDDGDIDGAKAVLERLREFQRGTTPQTADLEATIGTLEAIADAED